MSLLHRILVATDFSAAGHAAVSRAGQLAGQYQCQLLVFHATPDWTLFCERANANQQHYAQITRNADDLLRSEISWLGSEYHLTTARGEVHRDRATVAVTRAIESFQPDLLVIGGGGEHLTPGGDTALGGTALKLMSQVNVPLLLIRTAAATAYQSTLAAVRGDFGNSRRVLAWASTLAGTGPCHVVRAYDAPYAHRLRLSRLDDIQIEQSAQAQLHLAEQDCEALEHSLQPAAHLLVHIVRGAPIATVLQQVKQHAPQLLVIGQHQHRSGEPPGAWAAGVGTRIAYHCPTDVLIVP
jgi:nucleotide-binding universal stress UspA family protein